MFGMLGMMLAPPNMEKAVSTMESVDNLKDVSSFETCKHDNLPQEFPDSSSGFDRQYTLNIGKKAVDIVNFEIEVESLVTVFLNPHSSDSKVNAFIYDTNGSANHSEDHAEKALAWTKAASNQLSIVLQP